MSAPTENPPGSTEPPATPETTAFLLGTFADLYRQEVAAEEDVHRTLPFFGTALGVGVAALVYAAGRLPRWSDLTTTGGRGAFIAASVLLVLSIFEAGCVLVWVSRAIARRPYQRIGPEPALRARLSELQAYYESQGTAADTPDAELVKDIRQVLLDSYTMVTPINRALTERRYRLRALAGMNRPTCGSASRRRCVPRARGDEPWRIESRCSIIGRSPRTRG